MEAIKNYLENMFSSLPNTPEVQRAKNELWQMMEDKYTELKAEGRSENEAVGTVITEFGNLDELSEALGIRDYIQPQHTAYQHTSQNQTDSDSLKQDSACGDFDNKSVPPRLLPMEEAREYIRAKSEHALCLALGIFFCIISPIASIVTNDTVFSDIIGSTGLFVCIAIGVFLIVFSGVRIQKWDFLKKEPCSLDFATTQYVKDRKEQNRTSFALFLTAGIALCIISVVPSCIFSEIDLPSITKNIWIARYDIGSALLFLLIALGVFMIVLASVQNEAYNTLLKLNPSSTMGGNFVPEQKSADTYSNQTITTIMSVFWPTVTCLYLIWSFLTFDWWITWILWPIAVVIELLMKNIWKK